jgi:hypothetical protein
MKAGSTLRARLARLERDRGMRAEGEGEQNVSLCLYTGSMTRADALAFFWNEEKRDAEKTGRKPDPQRPLAFLRLLDTMSWPIMIRHGRDHRRSTNFALDFSTWSGAEVAQWTKAGDLGASPPTDAEAQVICGMVAKLEALDRRAEATWADDEREMRLIVAGPQLGGPETST